MLLPYTYDPVTQDVWLYEEHTLSWSLPTAGSTVIKRPYAWNPDSPLYGYRYSLAGMSARPRTMSTYYGSAIPPYDTVNPAANPVNRPVWYNSWPMTMLTIGSGMMLGCKHCYGGFYWPARNAAATFVGPYPYAYQPNTYLAAIISQAFRFIDGDNQVTELDPTNITVYETDPPNLLNLTPIDLVMFESLQPSAVSRLYPVDPRSLPFGATEYVLDSNHKIVRVTSQRQYVERQQIVTNSLAVNPDGSAVAFPPQLFLHDSGSFALVEISPPTSVEAGDGIMGVCCASNIGTSEWVMGTSSTKLVFHAEEEGFIANYLPIANPYVPEYLSDRGKPMRPLSMARRTGSLATETVEQQILTTLNGIPYGY